MFPKPSTSLSPLVFLNLIDDAGVAMLKECQHFPRQSHTLWPHDKTKIKKTCPASSGRVNPTVQTAPTEVHKQL